MYIFVFRGLSFTVGYIEEDLCKEFQEFVLYWQDCICGNSTTRLSCTCRTSMYAQGKTTRRVDSSQGLPGVYFTANNLGFAMSRCDRTENGVLPGEDPPASGGISFTAIWVNLPVKQDWVFRG